jgi:hypothetical protein
MKIVYFKETMFGRSVVECINKTPFGVSVVTTDNTSKAMPWETVESTCSSLGTTPKALNLTMGYIE